MPSHYILSEKQFYSLKTVEIKADDFVRIDRDNRISINLPNITEIKLNFSSRSPAIEVFNCPKLLNLTVLTKFYVHL